MYHEVVQTIILEGIATSGKSTVVKMLTSAVSEGQTVRVVPETETVMPILDNTDKDVAMSHIKSVLEATYKTPHDLVIFDRLYLTHIFRVHGSIKDFLEIEQVLAPHDPVTIFLEVDEGSIAERVELASQHRDPEWKQYIATKGETFSDIAGYYIRQQRNQKELLKGSKIPYKTYNTSSHNYAVIVQDILK